MSAHQHDRAKGDPAWNVTTENRIKDMLTECGRIHARIEGDYTHNDNSDIALNGCIAAANGLHSALKAVKRLDGANRVLVDTLELSRLVSEVLSFHESLSMDSANDRETLRAALVEVLGVQLG